MSTRSRWTRILRLGAVTALTLSLSGPHASAGDLRAAHADAVNEHIDAVLDDPAVSSRIVAWGLSVADVRHDVDAMTLTERTRLARTLTRRWRTNETHSTADLQAQYLVTLSLMRASTLYASVITLRLR